MNIYTSHSTVSIAATRSVAAPALNRFNFPGDRYHTFFWPGSYTRPLPFLLMAEAARKWMRPDVISKVAKEIARCCAYFPALKGEASGASTAM